MSNTNMTPTYVITFQSLPFLLTSVYTLHVGVGVGISA